LGKPKFNFKTAAKPQQIPYSFALTAYSNFLTPCPTPLMLTTKGTPLPPNLGKPKFKFKLVAKPESSTSELKEV